MSFTDAMSVMLPPRNGVSPHITAPYGESRAKGPHGGVDFNYVGGQSGVNLTHPEVRAPIAGDVTFVGGQFGTIKIKDAEGYSHEILHTHTQSIASPSRVRAGEPIGTMGGRGPAGSSQYAQHVHYQLRDPNGKVIDPKKWWDDRASSAGAQAQRGPWAYPFGEFNKKGATDSALYLGASGGREGALSRSADGFYPIGANGLWHGGIHFDAGSGTLLDQRSGVRCINDGEVIAYLVNEKYPEIEFQPSKKRAAYSSSFTLVRHRLELPEDREPGQKVVPVGNNAPAAAKAQPATDASKQPPNRETLVFYSLYMHQLDWHGYKQDRKLPHPAYWAEPKRFRVGAKAADKQDVPSRVERQHVDFITPALDVEDIGVPEFAGCGWDHMEDDGAC